jgi:hypothetical protein
MPVWKTHAAVFAAAGLQHDEIRSAAPCEIQVTEIAKN